MDTKDSKPLTLDDLCNFTEQVLLPSMEERFATKDDLKNFATKDDIKDLKEELQNLPTKDYIDKLVTKEDQIAKSTEDVKIELAASAGARVRQQDEIDTIEKTYKNNKKIIGRHEIRIKKLEIGLSPI